MKERHLHEKPATKLAFEKALKKSWCLFILFRAYYDSVQSISFNEQSVLPCTKEFYFIAGIKCCVIRSGGSVIENIFIPT